MLHSFSETRTQSVMFLDIVTQNLWESVGLVAALWFAAYYLRGRSKNTPPGPWGLPIIGVAPFIGQRPDKVFTKWAEKYGDVMEIKVGSNRTVILSSYEAIQEAFVKNAVNDRPNSFLLANVLTANGIIAANYTQEYATRRKFVHRTLSKHGVGKKALENYFTDEVDNMIKIFGDGDVEVTQAVKEHFKCATANVMLKIATGERYKSYQDSEFQEILQACDVYFKRSPMLTPTAFFFPWTSSKVKTAACEIINAVNRVDEIIGKKIASHKESLRKSHNAKGLIDEYLLEMKSNGQTEVYTEKFLVCAIRDLFFGSLETSTSTMVSIFLLLANRPEIIKKIHNEIDRVVGKSGEVDFALRKKLPYCHSVIKESMRFRILSPSLVAHKASENLKVRGYDIPKGSTVVGNVYAVMHDPQHWNSPGEFIPERHLDEDGNVVVSKYFMPFGVGPRTCIGRRIAEMEIFIFFVKLFQRYDVIPIPTVDCRRPHVDDEIVLTRVSAVLPDHTQVKLTPRDVNGL